MESKYQRISVRDSPESDLADLADRRPSFSDEKPEYAASESSNGTLFNEDIENLSNDRRRVHSSCAASGWVWFVHAVLLTASISFWIRGLMYAHPSTAKFVEEFSIYSPAASIVEYEDVKFDGNFSSVSEYVGASAAVDAAWSKITYDVGDQMITAAELKKVDLSTDAIKVTHPKTGVEGYRVGLEVFHQLQCLNLLRKVSFFEHYEMIDADFKEGKEGLRRGVDQCLEMLRMNLQCQSDVGVVTFREMSGLGSPSPDFSTWHTCRNFDKVRDWAMENAINH